ncbi:MAG: ATP-binding cassette domain-containing protein [Eubacteriales bacterium]|nr:ATP-binding cassette domain-containing protein [Eubacteriales bacterium]
MQLKNIYKAFENKKVLENFSLSLHKGDIICLMGESGIGKTTLFNIILGLIKPDSGEIIDPFKSISCVFQEDRLLDGFSSLDNLRFVLGDTIDEETLIKECAKLNIDPVTARQDVATLSGGQRRRIAILRALLYPHELLLLDEAFKGLDEHNRNLAIDYIKQNSDTILIITHDAQECRLFGGRAIQINTNLTI